MIHIRRYTSSDLEGMMTVRRDAILAIPSTDYSQDQLQAWARDRDDLDKQHVRFNDSATWVAEHDNTIVGFTNLKSDGYLDCMYVSPQAQRGGVATGLLAALEAYARSEDIKRLHSDVSITARPFFEQQGFTVNTSQTVTFNGFEYTNYRMEKQIGG